MMLGIVVGSVFLFLAFMLVVAIVVFFLTKKKPQVTAPQPSLQDWERSEIVGVVEQHLNDAKREETRQRAAAALQAATQSKK